MALVRILSALALVAGALALAACGGDAEDGAAPTADRTTTVQNQEPEKGDRMKIRLTVGEDVLEASLLDNPTSRDFASLLPLTLTLSDYAQTEKVSDLPQRLSTADAPAGVDPEVGDITYYAPWGNLAIFYREFGYASGLVKVGSIDSGIEALRQATGDFTVTIERAD